MSWEKSRSKSRGYKKERNNSRCHGKEPSLHRRTSCRSRKQINTGTSKSIGKIASKSLSEESVDRACRSNERHLRNGLTTKSHSTKKLSKFSLNGGLKRTPLNQSNSRVSASRAAKTARQEKTVKARRNRRFGARKDTVEETNCNHLATSHNHPSDKNEADVNETESAVVHSGGQSNSLNGTEVVSCKGSKSIEQRVNGCNMEVLSEPNNQDEKTITLHANFEKLILPFIDGKSLAHCSTNADVKCDFQDVKEANAGPALEIGPVAKTSEEQNFNGIDFNSVKQKTDSLIIEIQFHKRSTNGDTKEIPSHLSRIQLQMHDLNMADWENVNNMLKASKSNNECLKIELPSAPEASSNLEQEFKPNCKSPDDDECKSNNLLELGSATGEILPSVSIKPDILSKFESVSPPIDQVEKGNIAEDDCEKQKKKSSTPCTEEAETKNGEQSYEELGVNKHNSTIDQCHVPSTTKKSNIGNSGKKQKQVSLHRKTSIQLRPLKVLVRKKPSALPKCPPKPQKFSYASHAVGKRTRVTSGRVKMLQCAKRQLKIVHKQKPLKVNKQNKMISSSIKTNARFKTAKNKPISKSHSKLNKFTGAKQKSSGHPHESDFIKHNGVRNGAEGKNATKKSPDSVDHRTSSKIPNSSKNYIVLSPEQDKRLNPEKNGGSKNKKKLVVVKEADLQPSSQKSSARSSNRSVNTMPKTNQTAKKTLPTSHKDSNLQSKTCKVENPPIKKKKRKHFRGGRYSLSISGVPKKKRKVVEPRSVSLSPSVDMLNSSSSTPTVLPVSVESSPEHVPTLLQCDSVPSPPNECASPPNECASPPNECASPPSSISVIDLTSEQSDEQNSGNDSDSVQPVSEIDGNTAPRQVAKKSFYRNDNDNHLHKLHHPSRSSTDEGNSMDSDRAGQSIYDYVNFVSEVIHSPSLMLAIGHHEKSLKLGSVDGTKSSNVSKPLLKLKSGCTSGSSKRAQGKPIKNTLSGGVLNQLRRSENYYNSQLRSGDVANVAQVLGDGADPNHKFINDNNNTPLHIATSLGLLSIVQLLIQAGSVIENINDKLKTPLMIAIEKKRFFVFQYLLKAGANLFCKDETGMTPFHIAAMVGDLNVMKMIYETRLIDVNNQDDGGWTALVWACEHRHYDVMRWLLEIGADPSVKDKEMNNALHWAAFSGCEKCVLLVLEKGIDVDTQNKVKESALHIASRRNHYECVKLLLSHGASRNLKNQNDLIPLMCCTSYNSELWKLLQEDTPSSDKNKSEKLVLLSDLAGGREMFPIEVLNDEDKEQFVLDFCYTTSICESSNVNINRIVKSMKSCQCQDICTGTDCSCAMLSLCLWYGKDHRLIPNFNMFQPPVIFECSKMCSCSYYCTNRVVQHGTRCHLELFRTLGKGWGVRSRHDILRGSFICEFLGELLTDEEADKRDDDSYIFRLDSEESSAFCIDAKSYGNISRFLNHSCVPNLTPIKVFTDHQDLNFPHVAFFSNRDIKANEELCFDYGEKFWLAKSRSILCVCGYSSCKYSTDTIGDFFLSYFGISEISTEVADQNS